MSDQTGIEIHFDDRRGLLELACEPEVFATYREIAREQLKDFPEIDINEVMEINIVSTAAYVARRDAPRRRIFDVIAIVLIVAVLFLAAIGARTLMR